MGHPQPLIHLFSVFFKLEYKFYKKEMSKNPGSNPLDLNSHPSDYESPPLTIRPGLGPDKKNVYLKFPAIC